jgi:hypothetical protein
LQNEILNVVEACKKHAMKFHEMHIRNQRIWIRITPLSQKSSAEATLIAKDVIPTLKLISSIFTTNLSQTTSTLKDPFYFKAAIFLSISTGMGIMGACHLVTLVFLNEPFTVDVGELFSMSFVLGTVIISALIFTMFVVLGKTARAHLVLLELLIIGYFGAVASSFSLARDINIEWDNGSPKQYIVEVHNKTISRGRRHTSYYLHVDDWLHPGQQKSISVSSTKYKAFNIGDRLEIDQYPGYLGFKWVDEIKKYSPDY